MARSVTVASVGRATGATSTSHGRRVLTASVRIEAKTERLPKAATLPLVHTRLFPSIDSNEPAVHELQLGTIGNFECGTIFTGFPWNAIGYAVMPVPLVSMVL